MDIRIRPLEEADLGEADRIFRSAFAAFMGVEDPDAMFRGRDMVTTRWRASPGAALAAEHEGRLVATNFAARWGGFGFFGPVTVRPDYWDKRIAQALLEPTMALFDQWGIVHRGLFTFPQSAKHIHLYERYGFRAGHLTPIFEKAIAARPGVGFERLSTFSASERDTAIEDCRSLTGEVLEDLDLTGEIASVLSQGLGEVCLVFEGATLAAFAICHLGTGTEAGDNACYVKFGAVRPSEDAAARFARLIAASEAVAFDAGLGQISLGVNMGRRHAYEQVQRSGYRTVFIGVAMETRPDLSYNRPDVFVIDDWR